MSLPSLVARAVLAVSQTLWVAGPSGDRCGGPELLAALHQLRPALTLRSGQAPAGSRDRQIVLERGAGNYTVRIEGGGEPLVRSFFDPQDCGAAGGTAGLIVDRALDELRPLDETPELQPFTPRRWLQLAAAIGGGVEQGPLGWSPAIAAEGLLHLGLGEIFLGLDLIPSASGPVDSTPSDGNYLATSFGIEVGGGVAPHLGPGRWAADAAFGWATALVSLSETALGSPFYQQQQQIVAEPFVALRLGYSLDLPEGLFVGLRAEERLALARATLQLEGDSSISTRAWSFASSALLGWRFF